MEALNKKRGCLKAKLTVFKNFISNTSASLSNLNEKLNDELRQEVELRLVRAKETLDQFDAIQESIDSLSDDLSETVQYRETFESQYFEIVQLAKQLLNQGLQTQQNLSNPSSGHDQSLPVAEPVNAASLHTPNVKLPTIELPKFNGELSEWLGFRDTYQSLIHNNQYINDIQKFHYLKASLSANVCESIKSLEFSELNYQCAWNTLCNRYNSKKLLVHNHIKSIFSLKPMKRESADEIRQVLDTLTKHVHALTSLGEPTQSWDSILIYVMSAKLDSTTARSWEQEKARLDTPKLNHFTSFLISRAEFLRTLEFSNRLEPPTEKRQTKIKSFLTTEKAKSCILCKQEHYLQNCTTFLSLTPQERAKKLKELNACLNCLRKGHLMSNCKGGPCRKCNRKHNTLIHFDDANNAPAVSLCSNGTASRNVLATAMVLLQGPTGLTVQARLVLHSCSQSNFVSEYVSNKLQLHKTPVNVPIETLNDGSEFIIKNKCIVHLSTHHNSFETKLTCLIAPKIIERLPHEPINLHGKEIPLNLKLADPSFNIPGRVDILLGAEWFWRLLCIGQIVLNQQGLVLQKTKLGWIVGGPMSAVATSTIPSHPVCNLSLNDKIENFWRIENLPDHKPLSFEEKECEKIFVDTFSRDKDGRFLVNIPLRDNTNKLGNSRELAELRLLNLEKRLDRQPELNRNYSEFLAEYERLGQMSLSNDISCQPSYYLPHHCVFKSGKIRVVFDGSAPTSSGVSLNDIQMVGPNLQAPLFDILIRFRKHLYIISADVEKMYRQVLISPQQRALQRILWRSNSKEPIKTFNLNTVTYGTASASFLAVRALFQLGYECQDELPIISKIILNDFYVDDLLTGADTVEEAIFNASNISKVLKRGCFQLRKWMSNERNIIKNVTNVEETEEHTFSSIQNSAKTLGLKWNTRSDIIGYTVQTSKREGVTKRKVLSEISQIFDLLGLLGPVTILAKIFMQRLWQEKLSWDESLPSNLHAEWIKYKDQLKHLNSITIPRSVLCKSYTHVELHGFADASKTGYGACIYMRSIDEKNSILTRLLCSKSRVAPLKTQSIPRLELCAALLLSELMLMVTKALNNKVYIKTYWSDSSIVLSWVRLQPNVLPVFVANRISRIQELTFEHEWRHVPTSMNPADVLSRGIHPQDILNNSLWWHGPIFLQEETCNWPKNIMTLTTSEEVKTIANCSRIHQTSNPICNNLLQRFSDLNKSCRILSYVCRFCNRLKRSSSEVGFITPLEIDESLLFLIKCVQMECFSLEFRTLEKNQPIKGKLSRLALFIDNQNMIRVGGRLANSHYSYDKKFPLLLPSKHELTKRVILDEHLRSFHAGPQLLLYSVRQRFWPLRGRNLVRGIVHDCVRCFKARPNALFFKMGNLPQPRITPSYPFNSTGVDYAGPFLIKNKKGRGYKLEKCYIALFVCFCTKALHLEIVTDLSKDSFIAALRRFVSRRGKPANLHSDNGTSFVGAHNELKDLGSFLNTENVKLSESAGSIGINWHFIPAYSPHMGGLWEAGVKSVKFHLKRIASTANLTYEEFYTLLTQIESLLNSRPLSPLSTDPNDFIPLTPAHFLIGRTFATVVDPLLDHVPNSRLSNWQRIQSMQQHYWKRWSKEYISELQFRNKWKYPFPALQPNTLVLLKEDNLSPAKWRLGRVVETYPGNDGITRAASIKTASGIVTRSLVKLCPLPLQERPTEG
ncbi:uncharacterized protein [Prorops nasuta]|uniref:uncharacterized protein n=1 Tax=Prorops nasuta TaxID=863751 RepID=UPI0034CF0966